MNEKKPLVILTGPTAVGKTDLSVELALQIGGEIISADSMQVYRGMDIGSAKVTSQEMKGVRHHLIDILEPDEEFNVADFKEMARQAAEEIWSRGHIPIVAGGTGFYIQALLKDVDFEETRADHEYRWELETQAAEKGAGYLHEMLEQVDPEAARQIHPNNVKRTIRALEYYKETGTCISAHNQQERERQSPYNFAYFVLTMERSRLYERIDVRVDQMMAQGLLEEVQQLRNRGIRRGMVSMQGLGYKELLDHLEGEISLEEAVYLIKRDTRHFAKRQLTWFRREPDVIWLNKDQYEDSSRLMEQILAILKERKII